MSPPRVPLHTQLSSQLVYWYQALKLPPFSAPRCRKKFHETYSLKMSSQEKFSEKSKSCSKIDSVNMFCFYRPEQLCGNPFWHDLGFSMDIYQVYEFISYCVGNLNFPSVLLDTWLSTFFTKFALLVCCFTMLIFYI